MIPHRAHHVQIGKQFEGQGHPTDKSTIHWRTDNYSCGNLSRYQDWQQQDNERTAREPYLAGMSCLSINRQISRTVVLLVD